MNLKMVTSAGVALALAASPALAAPAPGAANPAASLSLAKNVRAGSKVGKSSKIAGGAGVLAALLLAGIVAIPVIDAVKDDRPSSP